ncbi:uncharacterized protein LOC6736526 isoform X2 [Drosophila simulans]|uniref:uncharacterized protein LOC6736526 isoform X2 n=1 Tax=Drosophila simulans TaxID=7240 RepID=UPI001D126C93|nr:uncharacterized protein LOC6736526 isoform X2 [Drosophila simulans]
MLWSVLKNAAPQLFCKVLNYIFVCLFCAFVFLSLAIIMFIWNYLTLLCFGVALIDAKSIKKSQANLLEPTLDPDEKLGKIGKSPPDISNEVQRVQVPLGASPGKGNWQGKWFPQAPGEPHVVKKKPLVEKQTKSAESTTQDTWKGKWFPQDTNEPHKTKQRSCDDGKSNLAVDFDPNDIRDSLNFLCISSNRSLYQPDLSREAILTEHFLPSAYLPPAKCLNESISYSHLPATNGPYRPMPAEYGTYSYLPPQRYVRNLAEGAIVMLYHPCAFPGQVKQLQDIVGGCLYRHLVSPSLALSPERPLALLAWSRSLEMSVVDRQLAADFIQKHAKQGPLAPEELSRLIAKRQTYKEGLLVEAHLVTTADDYGLCGYLEEM